MLLYSNYARTAALNFGENPNPDPDVRIFLSDSSPLRERAKKLYISHNISKGYGWIRLKLGAQV